jgi:hypothetical protein
MTSCYIKPNPDKGTIYGKLDISFPEKEHPDNLKKIYKKVRLELEDYGRATEIEDNGIFYFVNVPPGRYNLKAAAPDFGSYIMKNVEVSADSISLVYNIYLSKIVGSDKSDYHRTLEWKKKKIKTVPIDKRGAIEGTVYDRNYEHKFVGIPTVILKNTHYGTLAPVGSFLFSDILPGSYDLESFDSGYVKTTINNIKVKPDSVAFVEIILWPDWSEPPDKIYIKWKEKYFPLK